MSNAIVLATAPLDTYATSTLAEFGTLKIAPDIKETTIAGLVDGVVALVVRGAAPITASVIDNADALRVIGRTGVGYDTVDIEAATRRGIPVVYTPGAGARAVAEATIGYMLALAKRMVFFDRQLKAGNWKSRYEVQGGDLDGKVLGIIGLGRIGRIVAAMAKPFDMTVIAHDPYISAEEGKACGARMVGLEQLAARVRFHLDALPADRGDQRHDQPRAAEAGAARLLFHQPRARRRHRKPRLCRCSTTQRTTRRRGHRRVRSVAAGYVPSAIQQRQLSDVAARDRHDARGDDAHLQIDGGRHGGDLARPAPLPAEGD